jgi:hypothetical protein
LIAWHRSPRLSFSTPDGGSPKLNGHRGIRAEPCQDLINLDTKVVRNALKCRNTAKYKVSCTGIRIITARFVNVEQVHEQSLTKSKRTELVSQTGRCGNPLGPNSMDRKASRLAGRFGSPSAQLNGTINPERVLNNIFP